MATALILLLSALSLGGCASARTTATAAEVAERQVQVVSTTNLITDLVREVGGDRVRVTGLMGPGVDPHLYKATAGDVRELVEADLILYGGLELEGKMEDVFSASPTSGRPSRCPARCRGSGCARSPGSRTATTRTSGSTSTCGATPWRRPATP